MMGRGLCRTGRKASLSSVISQFRTGEVLEEMNLGYTTLGTPKRDSLGAVTNAVLLLHGTTGTGASWLQPSLADTIFRPGQSLDAENYYLILPDSIGLGRSSKPSDGLKGRFPHYGYQRYGGGPVLGS